MWASHELSQATNVPGVFLFRLSGIHVNSSPSSHKVSLASK